MIRQTTAQTNAARKLAVMGRVLKKKHTFQQHVAHVVGMHAPRMDMQGRPKCKHPPAEDRDMTVLEEGWKAKLEAYRRTIKQPLWLNGLRKQ